MWMPSQMKLPQHVDNFEKMGVKLDAKTLSESARQSARGGRVARWLHRVVRLGEATR